MGPSWIRALGMGILDHSAQIHGSVISSINPSRAWVLLIDSPWKPPILRIGSFD
jgi:hypothetical protein